MNNYLDTKRSFDESSENTKPRILFVGLSESSHARSFTELFVNDFNIRFFAMPTYVPPNDWPIKTYLTCPNPPENMDSETRLSLHPTPEAINACIQHFAKRRPLSLFVSRVLEEIYLSFEILFRRSITLDDLKPPQIRMKSTSPYHWLVEIIQAWKPDIIHTFGIDGGIFLQDSWKMIQQEGDLPYVWIQQTRGGSDLTFNRFDPDYKDRVLNIFNQCDSIICDNVINLKYLEEMGVDKKKFAPICPVPGAGGQKIIEHSSQDLRNHLKSRDIVWPKAYLCPYSLSLPVLEAIKLAWDRIQPCTIHFLAADQDTRLWYFSLPENIRNHCLIYDRIPREKVQELMKKSRVMIAPSLIDGVPNVLYEAMAAGALPIVSPLDTIKSMISEKNALFVDNMNPKEIADAIISAMADDELVSEITLRNFEFVKENCDRNLIQKKVVSYYISMLGEK